MMNQIYELQRAAYALSFLSPDCDRAFWAMIAMAIKSEFGEDGFEIFNNWSQGSMKYNRRDAEQTYKSVKPGGGVNIGTMYYHATQAGYKYSADRYAALPALTVQKPAMSAAGQEATRQNDAERYSKAAAECAELYTALPDAPATHPYLQKKQLAPVPGMKLGRDGRLVVPVYDAESQLSTLQYIDADGNKAFHRDGRVKGGYWIICGEPSGDLSQCEGVATGLSLNAATGHPVAIAYSKTNMLEVAKTLRGKHPDARLIICADNDRHAAENGGVACATAAAAAVGARLAVPEFTGDDGKDFDDLRFQQGLDAVRQQVEAAQVVTVPEHATIAPTPQVGGRYRVMAAVDLSELPPMDWLVRGVLPSSGLAAIYGASGCGKSFLALDVAAAIAGGHAVWFSRRISQRAVTYVALEGEQGIGKRVKAWSDHHGKAIPERLRFVTDSLNLRNPRDVEELGAAILSSGGRDGLVIIDTLNRAAEGAEENSSGHMGELIAGAKRLQIITAGLVVLVHHTGKDEKAGLRGHSSLHAALDAAVEVKRDGTGRMWRVAKSKDDEDGQCYGFDLEVVTVGKDRYGDEVSSCVIAAGGEVAEKPDGRKLGSTQQKVVDTLKPLMLACGVYDPAGAGDGMPAGCPGMHRKDAIAAVAQVLDCENSKRNNRAGGVIDSLVKNGTFKLEGEWLCDNC